MASRRGIITWVEMEIPPIPTARRALVSWVEMEIPDFPRRALVGWEEMEIPDPGSSEVNTEFIKGFQSASEAVAGLAAIEEAPTHPYLHALSVALKELAAQGEPVTASSIGTSGKLPKFIGSTRLLDSAFSETDTEARIALPLKVTGSVIGTGDVGSVTGQTLAVLSSTSGGGGAPVLSLRTFGTTKGLVGAASVQNELLIGAAAGDMVIRTQGGVLRFTVNSGVSTALSITSNGIDHIGVHRIQGVQVMGTRKTGYVSMDGAADRGSLFNTESVTLIQLARRVKALQDDFMSHGAIGA